MRRPVSLLKLVAGVGGVLLFSAIFQLPWGSGDVASRQTLSAISEEPDRIVLGWSGPVEEPMSERIAATLDRYEGRSTSGSSSSSIHRRLETNRGAR